MGGHVQLLSNGVTKNSELRTRIIKKKKKIRACVAEAVKKWSFASYPKEINSSSARTVHLCKNIVK